MDEGVVQEFYDESKEMMTQVESCLLKLEKNNNDVDAFDEVFRCIHSIKGTAMMCEFSGLADFTHSLENLLEKIQSKDLEMQSSLIDLVIRCTDVINSYLDELIADQECEFQDKGLLGEIEKFAA